ncbi:GNAT family N-acetyltransferase [Tunturiibacter psychrotolerans]|uniref:GNAT family N-acetyltransferase n=1 Tax=Tunturiibacter psychrotolerans TaxID=3069686 RepID=UPI003D1CBB20
MSQARWETDPRVEVLPAAWEQEPVLANLLELYAHDFSELRDLDVGEDGRFGYGALPLYWTEPGRFPFLVRVGGRLAGLVLVRRGSVISEEEAVWDMAEFFVVRGYRRRRIGTQVAHEVWRRFPGRWEVRVMEKNDAARRFWQGAISSFTGEKIHSVAFEREGSAWVLFLFESRVK